MKRIPTTILWGMWWSALRDKNGPSMEEIKAELKARGIWKG